MLNIITVVSYSLSECSLLAHTVPWPAQTMKTNTVLNARRNDQRSLNFYLGKQTDKGGSVVEALSGLTRKGGWQPAG
jgi:hypothetical protein